MLIECPECGKKNISDQAIACPKCGYPLKAATIEATGKRYKSRQAMGAIAVLIGFILIIIGYIVAGVILLILGLIDLIAGRIGAWWHHG